MYVTRGGHRAACTQGLRQSSAAARDMHHMPAGALQSAALAPGAHLEGRAGVVQVGPGVGHLRAQLAASLCGAAAQRGNLRLHGHDAAQVGRDGDAPAPAPARQRRARRGSRRKRRRSRRMRRLVAAAAVMLTLHASRTCFVGSALCFSLHDAPTAVHQQPDDRLLPQLPQRSTKLLHAQPHHMLRPWRKSRKSGQAKHCPPPPRGPPRRLTIIASSISARSGTLRAMGPSSTATPPPGGASGGPCGASTPGDGRMPTTPQNAARMRSEPPRSLPVASHACRTGELPAHVRLCHWHVTSITCSSRAPTCLAAARRRSTKHEAPRSEHPARSTSLMSCLVPPHLSRSERRG